MEFKMTITFDKEKLSENEIETFSLRISEKDYEEITGFINNKEPEKLREKFKTLKDVNGKECSVDTLKIVSLSFEGV